MFEQLLPFIKKIKKLYKKNRKRKLIFRHYNKTQEKKESFNWFKQKHFLHFYYGKVKLNKQ